MRPQRAVSDRFIYGLHKPEKQGLAEKKRCKKPQNETTSKWSVSVVDISIELVVVVLSVLLKTFEGGDDATAVKCRSSHIGL
jgi:hypothetical protein